MNSKNKRDWPLILFIIAAIVSLVFSILSVLISFWPGSLLLDLQYKWFDGYYYPKFTILILWVVILLVISFSGALIYYFFEFIYKKLSKKQN